jgi:hypothetical protein
MQARLGVTSSTIASAKRKLREFYKQSNEKDLLLVVLVKLCRLMNLSFAEEVK